MKNTKNRENLTDLENLMFNVGGMKAVKNMAIAKSGKYCLKRIKNHFGVEMIFQSDMEIRSITQWIKDNDPKFERHVINPYTLKMGMKNTDYVIGGNFIITLEKDTFAFVSADFDEHYRKEGSIIKMYIFGKKTYKYLSQITKLLGNTSGSNMLYSISAKGGADGKNNMWSCVGSSLTPRPMDTLFFDQGVKDQIINHLNTWVENENVYKSRGLIFKTGILLHGKAGTGKSSLATAIATYLNCGLITIDPTTFKYLNISEVVESINADTCRYVVLIDEIDTIFKSRDDDLSESQTEKTSKLLSFLDSQQSPNNVVFVATTNYYDRLDKALLRKGRFDLTVELSDISRNSAMEMCKSFNMAEDAIIKTMSEFHDSKINPATLQAKILENIKQM